MNGSTEQAARMAYKRHRFGDRPSLERDALRLVRMTSGLAQLTTAPGSTLVNRNKMLAIFLTAKPISQLFFDFQN
jgi:hypothetical protein